MIRPDYARNGWRTPDRYAGMRGFVWSYIIGVALLALLVMVVW